MEPIVLAHGFCGFKRFILWAHFNRVADTLREAGYTVVQPTVHPTRTIEVRSRQLLEQIEHELGPEQPYHVIAHSMGGLDARYLASPRGLNQGHRIRSITTVGTPHRGSPIAEKFPRFFVSMTCLSARVGQWLPFDSTTRQFLSHVGEHRVDGLDQLTPGYVREEFNPATPDHPDVRYFSYAGVVQRRDILFPRTIPWRYMYNLEGDNDAMVSVQSATWGEFLGTVRSDHGSLVGLHVVPGFQTRFDHLSFFREVADNLQQRFHDSCSHAA